jgi:flagellar biosynthesis regulator FlbT
MITTETTTLLKQIQSLQQSKVIEIEAQYTPLSQIYVIAKSKFHWNAIEIQRSYRLDDLMSAACEGNVLISIILIRAGYYIMILRLNLPTITQS